MTPLIFDHPAAVIIERRVTRRPDAALCLTLEPTYARGGSYSVLALRWTTARAAQGAPLPRWIGPHGVPVFIAPRLWRYLSWHPLRVRGSSLGPFTRLLPVATVAFDIELRQWERLHPGIELPGVAA